MLGKLNLVRIELGIFRILFENYVLSLKLLACFFCQTHIASTFEVDIEKYTIFCLWSSRGMSPEQVHISMIFDMHLFPKMYIRQTQSSSGAIKCQKLDSLVLELDRCHGPFSDPWENWTSFEASEAKLGEHEGGAPKFENIELSCSMWWRLWARTGSLHRSHRNVDLTRVVACVVTIPAYWALEEEV